MKKIIMLSLAFLLFSAANSFADTTYEYDSLGRVIKTLYDSGDCMITGYFNTSGTKRYETYFRNDGTWLRTTEYLYTYSAGFQNRKCMWVADLNPGQPGDVVYYEYRTEEGWYPNGSKVSLTIFDNGDYVSTIYRHGVSEVFQNIYGNSSGVWNKTVQYYNYPTDHTSGAQYQWTADKHAGVAGDEVYAEYDTKTRIINQQFDDGSRYGMSYYGSTNKVYQKWFALTDGNWQYTVEYYEDGATGHRKWIKDSDPAKPGDIVYEEYDLSGKTMLKIFDDGSAWSGQMMRAGLYRLQDEEGVTRTQLVLQQSSDRNAEGATFSNEQAGRPNGQPAIGKLKMKLF